MTPQQQYFKDSIIEPLIEQAEISIRAFEILNNAYGITTTQNQRNTLIVCDELKKLRNEIETLTIKQIHERFNTIIERNPATKRKVRRTDKISQWWAYFRGICRFGAIPKSN